MHEGLHLYAVHTDLNFCPDSFDLDLVTWLHLTAGKAGNYVLSYIPKRKRKWVYWRASYSCLTPYLSQLNIDFLSKVYPYYHFSGHYKIVVQFLKFPAQFDVICSFGSISQLLKHFHIHYLSWASWELLNIYSVLKSLPVLSSLIPVIILCHRYYPYFAWKKKKRP